MNPTAPARPDAATLARAFEALARYDRGSARGALQPIDDAVVAALRDPELRQELVARFGAILEGPAPTPAKEYACGKLALLGEVGKVSALAGLLTVPELAHAALHTLRSLPGPATLQALRESLGRVTGTRLAGVLEALGALNAPDAIPPLSQHLEHADPVVADAAAAGLARMDHPAAARALTRFLERRAGPVTVAQADAALESAARLRARGETAVARALLNALLAAQPAAHFRAAALRLLA